MPDSSSADRDPLDRLAEEFVERLRRGEHPSLTEYAARLPDRADEVRELFPALVEMEHLKPVSSDRTGAFVPETDPTHPGSVGEFRILRQVGRGGMGVVYEAVQESLGRHVALKILPAEAVADPKRLERFRREAKAAARLHHTNIVPVFGTGTADGRHFYAMQFISGHPLDAVIDEVRRLKENSAATAPPPRAVSEVAAALMTNTFAPTSPSPLEGEGLGERGNASTPGDGSPLTPGPSPSRGEGRSTNNPSMSDGGRGYFGTVARLGAQAADALAYAHAQGVLHRDIKPANLLLDLQGTVWVTDFGLAKSAEADDLTRDGDIVGTLRYMAPERFDGGGDARSDVYALGLTLYELLTLKPAFAADSRAKLVEQVLAASPPKPRAVNPAIPRDLETVVLKAIARDPAMRYQSAGELADDLRRYNEDRPIRARRASSAEQAFRWCRRNKAVASLIAAVILVSVAGAAVALVIAGHQKRTANELGKTLTELGESLEEVRRQQDFTGRLLYVSRINQAQAALNEGRIPRVMELLRETTPAAGEPDLRNWEWHHLTRLLTPDHEVSLGGTAPPLGDRRAPGGGLVFGMESTIAVFSHDGERVLTIHSEGNRRYYEVKETFTGRLVGRVPRAGSFPTVGTSPSENFQLSPRYAFGTDGKFLLVIPYKGRATTGDPASLDADAARLWNVDTGADTRLPAGVVEAVTGGAGMVLGPGGAWLTWLRVPRREVNPETGRTTPRTGPHDARCGRWERASDQISFTKPFRIGQGAGTATLTPDGATVYWQTARPGAGGKTKTDVEGDEPPAAAPGSTWFECWDVTTPEPTPRFKPRWIPRSPRKTTSGPVAIEFIVSTSGRMIARREWPDEVVIYRMSDGEEHNRLPLTGVPVQSSGPGGLTSARAQFLTVSDDGNRVVVRSSNLLNVIWNEPGGNFGRGPVSRSIPVAEAESSRIFNPSGFKLRADGKTFIDLHEPGRVRVWDVSRNRTDTGNAPRSPFGPTVVRDGKSYSSATTQDDRYTLEYPVDVTPLKGIGKAAPRGFGGPVVLSERGGRVIGPIPAPASFTSLTAQTLADGNRLLVRYQAPRAAAPGSRPFLGEWRLYEITPELRQIADGTGTLWQTTAAGVPYWVEYPLTRSSLGFSAITTRVGSPLNLHDGRTGDLIRSIRVPDRDIVFCEFDPTGGTYLVQSVEQSNTIPPPRRVLTSAELAVAGGAFGVNPRFVSGRDRSTLPFGPASGERLLRRSIRVHLYDTATGAERWARDIVSDDPIRTSGDARFSPDGRRVLVRYTPSLPVGETVPVPQRVAIRDRVWVARSDGTVERDFVMAETISRPTTLGEAVFGGGGASRMDFVVSPDGHHVALQDIGEVQVWNLDTGTLRHRLTGHGNRAGIAVAYNGDGSRLFTRDGPRGTGGLAESGTPIHVWDTTTGRELLTLISNNTRGITSGLEFVGEKLFTKGGPVRAQVFDGTPVKP